MGTIGVLLEVLRGKQKWENSHILPPLFTIMALLQIYYFIFLLNYYKFINNICLVFNCINVHPLWSVLASLPDGLKERLMETQERRDEFQSLHESTHSLSTTNALRRFSDSIIEKEAAVQSVNAEVSSKIEVLQEQSSDKDHLRKYSGELQSLLIQTPAIKVQFL